MIFVLKLFEFCVKVSVGFVIASGRSFFYCIGMKMAYEKTNLTFILWHIVDSFLSDVLRNLYVQLNNGTG